MPRRKVAEMGPPSRLRFGVFPRVYNKILILMFIMSQLRTAFFFVFALVESLSLSKLLLLDISCGNILVLSVITASLHALFSIKKCAKSSVFYVKTVKIRWRLGASSPNPLGLRRLGVSPPDPRLWPPFAKY